MDQRFGKTFRLRAAKQFTEVIRRGGTAANRTLVVHARRSPESHPRLGVTIPKKVGNAVLRNRWKRHIREAFRTRRGEFPGGYDLVVRPRRDATLDPRHIQETLVTLARRAATRSR